MQLPVFLQAVGVGVAIAAPVGPIGMLVIQRTLRLGVTVGLATGLGAAVADACYAVLGIYAVQAVIHVLAGARIPLALAGAGLLLWLAGAPGHPRRRGCSSRRTCARGRITGLCHGSSVLAQFVLTLANRDDRVGCRGPSAVAARPTASCPSMCGRRFRRSCCGWAA